MSNDFPIREINPDFDENTSSWTNGKTKARVISEQIAERTNQFGKPVGLFRDEDNFEYEEIITDDIVIEPYARRNYLDPDMF